MRGLRDAIAAGRLEDHVATFYAARATPADDEAAP